MAYEFQTETQRCVPLQLVEQNLERESQAYPEKIHKVHLCHAFLRQSSVLFSTPHLLITYSQAHEPSVTLFSYIRMEKNKKTHTRIIIAHHIFRVVPV